MKGSIKWMANNHVAANLMMMVFIVGGLFIGLNVKQEVFPEVESDNITITVAYPGAGPEEVEEGIIIKLEESMSGINGIKEITSSASEGRGKVKLEVLDGSDPDDVLQDVKAEVDRLSTLPVEAEEPVVSRSAHKHEVISIVVSGDIPERSLREQVEMMEDELLALPGITQTSLVAVRPYEISIEVPEATLQSYGLTLAQIADRVRSASLDLPAGTVKTTGGEVLIRTKEKRYSASEYADVTILQNPDGTEVKLGEIAQIKDAFADTDIAGSLDGSPAAMIKVYRVGDQKPDDISAAVRQYVDNKRLSLPHSIKITAWNDRSELFKGRKRLLLKNAAFGLVLVFLTLSMFLQIRLALWVMLGLPISFLGALMFMPALAVSINMISLFAFILVLGIVVDDAIVVGESIYEHRLKGKPYLRAAVDGAVEVGGPVIFAILSSIAAFLPLLFIDGRMGKFMKAIPLIVIPVLVVSLIECLYVLPAHLSIGRATDDTGKSGLSGHSARLRQRFSGALERFIQGPYARTLSMAISNRPVTMAIATAVLFVSVGLLGGGIIKFRFMPEVEGDTVVVSLQMPVGTTAAETTRVKDDIVKKGLKAVAGFSSKDSEILRNVFAITGAQLSGRHISESTSAASNYATIIMNLTPSEERDVKASQISSRWRQIVGEIPGVEAVVFKSNLMDFGAGVNVRLSHRNFDTLKSATAQIKTELTKYPGVLNIEDNFSQGKQELSLSLKPEARTLGITEAALAGQVRSAFYGIEALRLQRGRNEVKVMVRYPQEDRRSLSTLENMYIRTSGGQGVPFSLAAEIDASKGFSVITRSDRKRVVNVTADVAPGAVTSEEINTNLSETVLPMLTASHPGLSTEFEGQDKERRQSMQSMMRGFSMAMFAIFAMLAIPFRSYTQPMVVMAAIPFGIVGALAGHLLMGYKLSMLSLFGIVALSGVVVNDSLLLIDHINRMRHHGMDLFEAVMVSGKRRFRPILLTSLTTFFGLAPMIMETSVQAKFLVPMAISLAFGILFATVITLLLIPTLYMVLENFKLKLGFRHSPVVGFMEEEEGNKDNNDDDQGEPEPEEEETPKGFY